MLIHRNSTSDKKKMEQNSTLNFIPFLESMVFLNVERLCVEKSFVIELILDASVELFDSNVCSPPACFRNYLKFLKVLRSAPSAIDPK